MSQRTPKTDEQRVEFIPLYRPFRGKLPIPDTGICDEPCTIYKINNKWRKFFISAMHTLIQPDIWDSDDPDEIKAATDQVMELIGMSSCGCRFGGTAYYVRNSLDVLIAIENTKIFEAGGLDELAPDRPDTSFDVDTGDTGEEIARRHVALCWACVDYVASVAEKGIMQGVNINPAINLAVTGLSYIFDEIIGIGFGVITQGSIAAMTAVMNGDADILQVACCMMSGLAGQDVDQESFADSLAFCPDVEGIGGASLLSVVRYSIDDEKSWLAFVKALGSYMAATDSLSTCPCPGGEGCSVDFTIDNGNWEAVAGLALYDPGVGWGPSASGAQNHHIHITYRNFEDFTATQVRFTCTNDDDEKWKWIVETWDEFEVNIEQVLIQLPIGTTTHTFNLGGYTNIRRLQLSVVADEGILDRIQGRIVSAEILYGDCILPEQPV